MTPGARVAAAIDILDTIVAGLAAEVALTRWARNSRFAGSKDRAAVRDHVFDVVRHWRSDAVRGGGETGRARMIGRLRALSVDLDSLFTGEGYAPATLTEAERAAGAEPAETGDRWDLPDWLVGQFTESLGEDAERTALALAERAPVTLRVNTARTSVPAVRRALAEDGIDTRENPRAGTALTAVDGARKLRGCTAYRDGLIELQDAASQAAMAALPAGARVLDYCAGGGGKALALAAQGREVTAHDADPLRMRDLPERATRAGIAIDVKSTADLDDVDPFDVVLCDAPCSGSGTWRRAPEAKWSLTSDRLSELRALQLRILADAQALVAPGGVLAYATCSILEAENEEVVSAFLATEPSWRQVDATRQPVDDDGDGFFAAHLRRVAE